jgi:hypothetical protein
VDQYVDQLIDSIISKKTPKDVCTDLALCPGKQCVLCKTVVRQVMDVVSSNETRAQIHDQLYKVGGIQPPASTLSFSPLPYSFHGSRSSIIRISRLLVGC